MKYQAVSPNSKPKERKTDYNIRGPLLDTFSMVRIDSHPSAISRLEIQEQQSLEKHDSPNQAQAKSFFNCKFHQQPRGNSPNETDSIEKADMMGCIICKAQIQKGDTFLRESKID